MSSVRHVYFYCSTTALLTLPVHCVLVFFHTRAAGEIDIRRSNMLHRTKLGVRCSAWTRCQKLDRFICANQALEYRTPEMWSVVLAAASIASHVNTTAIRFNSSLNAAAETSIPDKTTDNTLLVIIVIIASFTCLLVGVLAAHLTKGTRAAPHATAARLFP